MLIETIASIAIGSVIMTAALNIFMQLRSGLRQKTEFTRVFMASCDQPGAIAGKNPERCAKVPPFIVEAIGHADKYYVYRQLSISDGDLEALLQKSKDLGVSIAVTVNDEIYTPGRDEIGKQITPKDIWVASS